MARWRSVKLGTYVEDFQINKKGVLVWVAYIRVRVAVLTCTRCGVVNA